MDSQQQQPESDATESNDMAALETAPLSKLPPSAQSDQTWQRLGTQISVFLAQLPDYLGRLFNEYKQPLTSVALILAAIITFRVVLAVIDALNDIPLLAPTFELVGIGYSIWLVRRYLLRKSTRQELSQVIQGLLNE